MVGGSNHQPVGGGLRGVLLRGYVLEKSWPRVSIRSPLPLYFLVRHLWVGARERAVNASGLARRRRNDKELSSSTFETVSKSGCRQTDSFRLGHEHTHTHRLYFKPAGASAAAVTPATLMVQLRTGSAVRPTALHGLNAGRYVLMSKGTSGSGAVAFWDLFIPGALSSEAIVPTR